MAKEDYYKTLGVGREASADDLKKSYRKLAMEHHPDRNPDDAASEAKFKHVQEAYDVLKDDQKRAAYDRFGHAAFEQGGVGAGGHGAAGGAGGGFADIFEEMFGDFGFGGRRTQSGPARGNDLRYNMEVSLEAAFTGVKTTIRVPTLTGCNSCAGSGSAKGSQPVECTTCQGRGRVRAQSGFFTVERTCPACNGVGRVMKNPCGDCGGAGRIQKEKTLSVTIPKGVEDGTRIRLANEGEAGLRGAPAGDLYIFLTVQPHRLFERDGANLYCQVPITMTRAALGGAVEVPTVDKGRSRLTIPAGTQAGQQFRLKNKGMPILQSSQQGDMIVQVKVETPVRLTKEQVDLLRQFEKAGKSENHSPETHSFFSKVKELWEDLKE